MNETILIIEDNISLRENTAELLELSGYKVLTAENGKKGLEVAKANHPALILCDIMMPELDGYSVLRALENIPNLAGTPFIFMTAKSEKVDIRKGMDLGADDYLTKPFEGDELISAVMARLKKDETKKKKPHNLDNLKQLLSESDGLFRDNIHLPNYKTRKYKKKEIVFSEFDIPVYFYFVLKGKVKTFKTSVIDKEYISGVFKEGDFFGYSSLFEDNGYMESAETMEDTEVILIPKEDFFQLIHNNQDLSIKFIKIITNNLAEAEQKLVNLAYNSARKKVAEAILYLHNKHLPHQASGEISFTAARDDISAIAGVVPESVSRNMTDFKNEKLIETSSGKIKILNINALQNLKN